MHSTHHRTHLIQRDLIFRKNNPASRLLRNTRPREKVCGVRGQLGGPSLKQDCWSNYLQVFFHFHFWKFSNVFIPRRNAPVASEKSSSDPESFEEVSEKQAGNLEDNADKGAEKLEDRAKTLEDEADHLELGGDAFIGPERKPPGYEELDRNKPTLKKIYPNLKNKYADAEKRKYDKKDWPSKDECKKFVSRYLLSTFCLTLARYFTEFLFPCYTKTNNT